MLFGCVAASLLVGMSRCSNNLALRVMKHDGPLFLYPTSDYNSQFMWHRILLSSHRAIGRASDSSSYRKSGVTETFWCRCISRVNVRQFGRRKKGSSEFGGVEGFYGKFWGWKKFNENERNSFFHIRTSSKVMRHFLYCMKINSLFAHMIYRGRSYGQVVMEEIILSDNGPV